MADTPRGESAGQPGGGVGPCPRLQLQPQPRRGCGVCTRLLRRFQLFSPAGRQSLTATRASTLAAIRARSEHYGLEPGASADVIPSDTTSSLAQDLRYTPQAHTPELVGLHKRAAGCQPETLFAAAGKAPDGLIVDIKEIDGPLPIGLDSPVLASLGEQYAYSHQGSQAIPLPSGAPAWHCSARSCATPLAQPGVHAGSPRAGADGLLNGERPGAGPGSPGSQGRAQPDRCSSDRQQSAVSRRHLRPAGAGGAGMGLAGVLVVLASRQKRATEATSHRGKDKPRP